MAGAAAKISDTFVMLFLAALLLPIAIGIYLSVDTTTWPSNLKLLWDMLPIAGLAGLVIYVLDNYGFLERFRRKNEE